MNSTTNEPQFESIEQLLQVLIIQRNTSMAIELINKYAVNLEYKDTDGSTSLMYAADAGCHEICELLIEKRVAIDSQNDMGATALMFAALKGRYEIVELLLSNFANIHTNNHHNASVLSYAVQGGNTNIVSLLLDKGISINQQDSLGNTALIFAVSLENSEIVKLLVSKGADLEIRNNDNQTAIAAAAIKDYSEIGKFLYSELQSVKKNKLFQEAKDLGIDLVDFADATKGKTPIMSGGLPRGNNDPNRQTRCIPASEQNLSIPFTQFSGWLKQIDASELNTMGLIGLENGFPLFNNRHAFDEKTIANIKRRKGYGVQQFTIPPRARRFAGDETLPRGRYWSVCQNEKGDDKGTLVGELYAYYDVKKAGYITIMDNTNEESIAIVKEHYSDFITFIPDVPAILVLFHSTKSKPNPFCQLMGLDASQPFGIYFPVTVKHDAIDKVIDLRISEVANQFSMIISSLKDESGINRSLTKHNRPFTNSFADILPTLLTQERGGGIFDQVIGVWCRNNDVNGLIFPSVRNDCGVEIENGKMISFSNWNFVDYRGAGKANMQFIDMTDFWESEIRIGLGLNVAEVPSYNIYEQAKIAYTTTGIQKGSWKANGIIATRQTIINRDLEIFLNISFIDRKTNA